MVNNKIKAAEENLLPVYNRFPIALDHGDGMYLYDTDGKEYLDFAAGFAVSGSAEWIGSSLLTVAARQSKGH